MMNFRYDINGLRAIAVIAVVLYHFNPAWIPGGFAGVDVFFVISGFLMTGIIFRGLESDSFNFFKFYVARANRIIPALAVLCLVLLVFGWFYLTPLDYLDLAKHVANSMLFFSNVIYSREWGYFAAGSHEKWLLHTWSLSVEWQFYIIYPIALVVLKRFLSLENLKRLIVIGTILGFVFSVIAIIKWPNPAYYLLSTRAWEMMMGGVAFLYPWNISAAKKKVLEIVGLLLILSSYAFVNSDALWTGHFALVPVLGAYLMIIANKQSSAVTNNKIFQNLGKWSYSIYLWHWPVVVLGYYFDIQSWAFYGLPLSIVLGLISFKFVECLGFKSFYKWIDIFKVKPVYMFLFVYFLSHTVYIENGIKTSYRSASVSPQANFLDLYRHKHENLNEAYWLKCNTYTSLTQNGNTIISPDCISKKNKDGGVFLWGDSHAEALSLGIRDILTPLNIPFYQKTSANCRASFSPTNRLKGIYKEACDSSNQLAIDSISKLKPDVVVIAQSREHEKTNWTEMYEKLTLLGVKRIVLVGPVPQWVPSLPRVMIKPRNWNTDREYITDSGIYHQVIETDNLMAKINFPDEMQYVSLIDGLCFVEQNETFCRVYIPGADKELLQVDYGHLSQSGSKFIVNTFLKEYILY
jgi:peptidoglycan/LPS O-acetylase OafA/YrhL